MPFRWHKLTQMEPARQLRLEARTIGCPNDEGQAPIVINLMEEYIFG